MKGKTKIIFSLVILLIITVIAGCVVFFLNQNNEEETTDIEWEDVYLDVLNDEDNFENLEDLKIQLCDFDKDEIPELVIYGTGGIRSGTSQMTKYLAKIYKYNEERNEATTINFDLEDEFQMEFLHNKETDDYNWYVVTDDEDIYDISLEDDDYEISNSEYDYGDDFEVVDENVNKVVEFDKDAASKEIKDVLNEAKENYIPSSELVPKESKHEKDKEDNDNKIISNVKNNCGYMIEYGGYKYYWKITKDSRDESGIYANYSVNKETENELVKVDKNGNEEIILKDKSMSNLAIANDNIFYSTDSEICSVDLNGENKTIYSKGEIKCVIGNDVICEDYNNSKIFRITSDGEETIATEVEFVGNSDEYVYYTTEDTDSSVLDLGIIYNGKDEGVVQSLSTSEYEYNYSNVPSLVTSVQEYKEKVYISYGYIEGTAGLIQESLLGVMDEDGSNYEMIYKGIATEDFYIYDDNGEILLVYEDGNAISVESKGKVEVDIEIPHTSESVYQDIDGKIWYAEKLTGKTTEIISENDLISDYEFVVDDEHMSTIYSYSVIDNEIYILIDNGIHDSENDIGWRYSYERTKTVLLKYNLTSEEIEKVYEF